MEFQIDGSRQSEEEPGTCMHQLARRKIILKREKLIRRPNMHVRPLYPNKDTILSLLTCPLSHSQLHQLLAPVLHLRLHSHPLLFSRLVLSPNFFHLLPAALRLLFHHLPRPPHVFSCNSLIMAFARSHPPSASATAFLVYRQMRRAGVSPNNYTFPFLLKSLSDLRLLSRGQSLHAHAVRTGHAGDVYVNNSLMDLYASCGLMRGCELVFDEMPLRDAVSWTVLIAGYRNAGDSYEALLSFESMLRAGVDPNQATVVNVLAACGRCGALEMGMWVHDLVRRSGWRLDVILGTSLVDMYGKCGNVDFAVTVFNEMEEKNVYTWNSLINGLALAKTGMDAIHWFHRMIEEGYKADEVTLLAVLCACTHSGLVQVGRQIFSSMANGLYGVYPGVKHYGCMIDLLGRAGLLEEALVLVEGMPVEPNKTVWGSLFASSRAQGNLEMCEYAARKLVAMEPENGAYCVVLSHIYAQMGRWSDAEEMRALMDCKGLRKDRGGSALTVEQLPLQACEA